MHIKMAHFTVNPTMFFLIKKKNQYCIDLRLSVLSITVLIWNNQFLSTFDRMEIAKDLLRCLKPYVLLLERRLKYE